MSETKTRSASAEHGLRLGEAGLANTKSVRSSGVVTVTNRRWALISVWVCALFALVGARWAWTSAADERAVWLLVSSTCLAPLLWGFFTSERRTKRRVEVGCRTIAFVDDDGRTRGAAATRSASAYVSTEDALVSFELADGRRVFVRTGQDEAEAMLCASGVDALEIAARKPIGLGALGPALAATLVSLGGALLGVIVGSVAFVKFPTIASVVTLLAVVLFAAIGAVAGAVLGRSSSIVQGIDGVARLGKSAWFVPFADLRSVSIERSVLVVCTVRGDRHEVDMGRFDTRVDVLSPADRRDAALFAERVERAWMAFQRAPRTSVDLGALARNGRAIDVWLRDLDAMGEGRSGPFRGAAFDARALDEAMRAPHTERDVRVACAWLLCARDRGAREDVLALSERLAHPWTRDALRAIGQGAPREALVKRLSRPR